MATIRGTWQWDEGVGNYPSDVLTGIANFTSGGVNFTEINVDENGVTYIRAEADETGNNTVNPIGKNEYQRMNFGASGQEVNDAFYAWFSENAHHEHDEEYLIGWETLDGIADAIRLKSGKNESMTAAQFSEEIMSLDTSKPTQQTKTVTIKENGTTTIQPDEGVDLLKFVTVIVDIDIPTYENAEGVLF